MKNFSFAIDKFGISLSTQDYGKGFYKKTQTYVTDLILSEIDGCYFDLHTDKPVSFDNTLRVFPTITKNGTDAYLLGVRRRERDRVQRTALREKRR